MTIAVDMEIRISLLQAVQAVLFFSLLIAVSAWDLRYRIIPDRFQAGIALLSFLNFAPGQLLGALGAVPYLIVALFCKREGGMGGGDIKLAGATGLVLGLPASLTASCLGLTGFMVVWSACGIGSRENEIKKHFLWDRFWQEERQLFIV